MICIIRTHLIFLCLSNFFAFMPLSALAMSTRNARPEFSGALTPFDLSPQQVFLRAQTDLSLWNETSAIQASWQNIAGIQSKRFTWQNEGRTYSAEYKVRLADSGPDWEVVKELNERAIQAWESARSCYGANFQAFANAYRDGNICPQAKTNINNLRQNTREVLSTINPRRIAPSRILECRSLDRNPPPRGKPDACDALAHYHRRYLAYSRPFSDSASFLEAIGFFDLERPRLHPLLQQIFLEEIATGYPFPRIIHLCIGCGNTFTIASPTGTFLQDGILSDLEHQRLVDDLIENYAHANNQALSELRMDIVAGIRSSAVAILLLDFMGPRPESPTCAPVGIWPDTSRELITALKRSPFGPLHEMRERLFVSLVQSCGSPLGTMTPINLNDLMATGHPRMNEFISFLARIGAWRKLPR